MFYNSKVGWGIVFSDAAVIISKRHIHHPMELIFNRPMIHGNRMTFPNQQSV